MGNSHTESAQVTEVCLDGRGRVRIERIVFGLGAAAWGEVVLADGGEILTRNFDRYLAMRTQSVPRIEVHLIDSDEPPTGVGEVSVPTAAPALANAIAALTGTRIRRLPFTRSIKIH